MLVTEKYKILENLFPDILSGLTEVIQKGKLHRRFPEIQLSESECGKLQKASELCELKILEKWSEQDTEDFKLLCSIYFDVASLFEVRLGTLEGIYETIKIISLGYLGEHSHFVAEYLRENQDKIENINLFDKWNERLLLLSFKALTKLVTKKSWNDISLAVNYVNQLRKEQESYENTFLSQVKEEGQPYGATELISLYHFAKTVEVLGQYLLEGKVEGNSFDVTNKITYHCNKCKEFASLSGNYVLELLYQYFEAFAIKLAKNTIWNALSGVNQGEYPLKRFEMNRYVLVNKIPVLEPDLTKWLLWMDNFNDKKVALTELLNDYIVSTVFLGLEYSFDANKTLLFITRVTRKGSWEDLDCERYSTYEEAEEGHKRMVEKWGKRREDRRKMILIMKCYYCGSEMKIVDDKEPDDEEPDETIREYVCDWCIREGNRQEEDEEEEK